MHLCGHGGDQNIYEDAVLERNNNMRVMILPESIVQVGQHRNALQWSDQTHKSQQYTLLYIYKASIDMEVDFGMCSFGSLPLQDHTFKLKDTTWQCRHFCSPWSATHAADWSLIVSLAILAPAAAKNPYNSCFEGTMSFYSFSSLVDVCVDLLQMCTSLLNPARRNYAGSSCETSGYDKPSSKKATYVLSSRPFPDITPATLHWCRLCALLLPQPQWQQFAE